MLAALLLILPLGLGSAVSPVMLTEQTVILAGPGGMRSATRFIAGAVLVLSAYVVALLLFGRAISLPSEPNLDAALDLALGLLLLLLAAYLGRQHRDGSVEPKQERGESRWANAAFPFGAFSMATNFSTLALVAPAVKEIASADVGTAGRAALALVLVILGSASAWVPVALTRIAPGPGERALSAFSDFMADHGRRATFILLIAAGVFFTARGVIRLV